MSRANSIKIEYDVKPFISDTTNATSIHATVISSSGSQAVHVDRKAAVQRSADAVVQRMRIAWPDLDRFQRHLGLHGTREETNYAISEEEHLLDSLEHQLLDACARARVHLATRRNSMAYVNSLSQDVLSAIFLYAVRSADQKGFTAISISHTCAYWRFVATRDPSLWSILDLNTLTRAQATLFASHSKTTPLRLLLLNDSPVRWGAPAASYQTERAARVQFCKSLLLRTESLDLFIPEEQCNFLTWLVDHEAPQLKRTTITWRSSQNIILAIPDLFGGQSGNLQNLALSNVSVPWSSLIKMTSLTRLHLHLSGRRDESQGNLDRSLLDFLLACPQLESLAIISNEKLRAVGQRRSSGPIPLRSLRSLKLILTSSDLATILSAIAAPQVMDALTIVCRLDGQSKKAEDHVLKLPTDPRCLPCISNFSNFEISSRGAFRDTIRGAMRSSDSDPCAVRLLFEGKHYDGVAVANTFGLILRHYPMPFLRKFTINPENGWDWNSSMDENIILFLRHCPNLTELYISGKCPS